MLKRIAPTLAVAAFIMTAIVITVPVAGLAAPTGQAPVDLQLSPAAAPPVDEAAALLAQMALRPAAEKVDDALRRLASTEPKRTVVAVVVAHAPVALPHRTTVLHRWSWPAGERLTMIKLPAERMAEVAAAPGVVAVLAGDPDHMPLGAPRADTDELAPRIDPRVLGDRARAAPPWSAAPAAGGTPVGPQRAIAQPGTDGWHDVGRGHAAEEAWQMGFRGEGVRVAVLDFTVDFAHPDLQGTWPVLPDGHPHAGWPQVFDPMAGYRALLDRDREPEERSTRRAGNGMIELYQTAEVAEVQIDGRAVFTACLQPLVRLSEQEPAVLAEPACDFVVPPTSAGGVVRYGHHPDTVLRDAAPDPEQGYLGQWAGVLLVDEAEPGVYDTVYVDVDGDRDFTDEKPMTRADPLSWRDLDGDGLADVSGGLLYFISDGVVPFPAGWVWGLEEEVPPAGEVIGVLYVVGDHGTLCASNIVSQGVVGVPPDRHIPFRDLPGDGQPPSLNLGLAPAARLVSIGDVYYGPGTVVFGASWRYSVFGHEIDRDDDDIHITNNSYGFSGVDNDGWDSDSRLVDHYVRTFSPHTSFLFSTGNGGFGYGTLAPPSPAVALGIAASTQMGSTSGQSITDTTQITFGDITPFSNRGPGADGRNGPNVAANGNSGTGAVPINFVADGAHSIGLWGGTSRSGPVAAGAMALVYQAFHSAHDRWPTWQEAQAILMSGARYAGYDTFTAGAGVVDAADAVRIAAGRHGIFATPPEWTPGGYRGRTYPAFAKLLHAGDSATTTLTLHNPSDQDVTVTLSGMTPRRIGSRDGELVTDLNAESPPSPVPDYLVQIERDWIPAGTELMVARARYPLREFDINGAYQIDNRYDFGVLQHTDENGDGLLWSDANGNGAVNHRQMLNSHVTAEWDGGRLGMESLQGAITPRLPEDGVAGDLAWYGRGCNVDDRPEDVTGLIALIARGECTFSEKILNAQAAGAVAVVMFTDSRPKIAMGGDGAGIAIPGVMIDQSKGLDLVALLEDGIRVTARVMPRVFVGVGLSGAGPIVYEDTEIQQWEYNRLSYDNDGRNHWGVPVHHPLERWADGMYLAWWHVGRSPAVTHTHFTTRLDFYAYQDWPALRLDRETLTIPAGGRALVEATFEVPADAAPGALQGAVFLDYERREGDTGEQPPGGYELPFLRTVVPVNVNVAARYEWQGAVELGGPDGRDAEAPYDNGAMWGTFKWDWRPESGDWRFFFLDAAPVPPNTYWLFRTTWSEADTGHADIDTRVYSPASDRFSQPHHATNEDEDRSDPDWYGPYPLGLLARSPYLVRNGSIWPFNTTSGGHEDWLLAPAGEGLHEVMLHNVLFGGSQFAMPFTTTVSSLRVNDVRLRLYGEGCSTLQVTPQTDLAGFTLEGFGMSVPEVLEDVPITEDDPDDVTTSSFRHDVNLETRAGRFEVLLEGQPGDDLDLFVLYDANGDGEFSYPDEVVGRGTTETAVERVSVSGFPAAGAYQIWVHGYRVEAEDSTFRLTIDIMSGRSLLLGEVPDLLPAGRASEVRVCADLEALAGEDGPAEGVLVGGPGGAPTLLRLPVSWSRHLPEVYLPAVTRGVEMAR